MNDESALRFLTYLARRHKARLENYRVRLGRQFGAEANYESVDRQTVTVTAALEWLEQKQRIITEEVS